MNKVGWCGDTSAGPYGPSDPPDDEPEDDSPYCECQLEATEDEDAENCCACCGRPLR